MKRKYPGQFGKLLELVKQTTGVKRWEIVSDKMEVAREVFIEGRKRHELNTKRAT